jgi:cytochrome b involved in lipid metabolism
MIINGGVYDVTKYIDYHPGGHNAILKFAGKDGSENVQFHSEKMMRILDTYFYIGKLEGYKNAGCLVS